MTAPLKGSSMGPGESRRGRVGKGTENLDLAGGCALMDSDRAVGKVERHDDMRHPSHVWTDPTFANEPLERLREEYMTFLKGRARPTSPETVGKYGKTLLAFLRFLESSKEPAVLGSVTPLAVSQWVTAQREKRLSEEGIASRLSALKVFTRRYIHEHLEMTTVDLLRKVARITPPERSYPMLTDTEQGRVLEAFDRGTFEDVRNRAMIAVYLATGMRFSEVLNVDMASFDRVTGEIRVIGKGNKERWVRLSPGAMREVKAYLKKRPEEGPSDRLWLTENGSPLTYWGAQSVFRRLKDRSGVTRVHAHLLRHNFAKKALQNGAERGVLQDMMGHATTVMTNRYLGDERKAQASREMPRYSPI